MEKARAAIAAGIGPLQQDEIHFPDAEILVVDAKIWKVGLLKSETIRRRKHHVFCEAICSRPPWVEGRGVHKGPLLVFRDKGPMEESKSNCQYYSSESCGAVDSRKFKLELFKSVCGIFHPPSTYDYGRLYDWDWAQLHLGWSQQFALVFSNTLI